MIPPLTGVPQTNDDTLYVIYLPRSMDIVDGGCGSLSGVHFFGAAPNFKFLDVFGVPLPIPVPYAQTFAYAVIPTKCASGDAQGIRDHITEAASHEIVEAATDPLVGTGWMNNIVTGSDGNILSLTIDQLSNVGLDLRAGEVADICEEGGNGAAGIPAPDVRRHAASQRSVAGQSYQGRSVLVERRCAGARERPEFQCLRTLPADEQSDVRIAELHRSGRQIHHVRDDRDDRRD